jgi:uncharacterized protein (TIGR02996 family)
MDEATFRTAILAEPENHALRLIFADFLEEQGDHRAEGFRWMGQNEKHPYYWVDTETWDWWNLDGAPNRHSVPAHSILPGNLFVRLKVTNRRQNNRWMGFDSAWEAQLELCEAILRADPVPQPMPPGDVIA